MINLLINKHKCNSTRGLSSYKPTHSKPADFALSCFLNAKKKSPLR